MLSLSKREQINRLQFSMITVVINMISSRDCEILQTIYDNIQSIILKLKFEFALSLRERTKLYRIHSIDPSI